MKKYTLNLGKSNKPLQLRGAYKDEKKFLEIIKKTLNEMNPFFNFTISDIVRMSFADFGNRIISGKLQIDFNLGEKEITFKVKKD